MKLGFIISHYPSEKRVALLPLHVNNFENDIVIEHNFGLNLNIKPNFIKDNSFIAGYSAVLHALLSFGMIPDHNTNIAVLGCGNVS